MKSKRKINCGIITMHRVINYGSVLQALALQEALCFLGVNAKIIDYVYPESNSTLTNKTIICKLKELCALVLAKVGVKTNCSNNYFKRKSFELFRKRYLKTTKKEYSRNDLSLLEDLKFDIFVTGSDQVWNPKHMLNHTAFMLSFVKDNSRKYAFSASTATVLFQPSEIKVLMKYLSQYQAISVREHHTANRLEEISGKKVFTTCDPTLLLDEDQWLNYVDKTALKPCANYIFVYVLSYEINPYPYLIDLISEIRNTYKLPIIAMGDVDILKSHFDIKTITNASPSDFLNLIRNANLVITSSYHGTIFSLIFKRPFISLIQKNISNDSRAYSLLNRIGAHNHLVEIGSRIEVKNLLNEADYSTAIASFRKESINYINEHILSNINIV